MDLLQTATDNYRKLLDKEYNIVVGKNKQLFSYKLTFTKHDFKHIIGLHKLKDLPDVYTASSEKLYDDIVKQRLDLSDINNSAYIAEVLNRVENLVYLESYLDTSQTVYQWDKNKSPFSDIDANIMLPVPSIPFNNETAYVFFKSYDGNKLQIADFFTDSVLKENPVSLFSTRRDYTKGQVRPPALLYKDKIELLTGNKTVILDKLSPTKSLQNEHNTSNKPMQMSISEDNNISTNFTILNDGTVALASTTPPNDLFTQLANNLVKGLDNIVHRASTAIEKINQAVTKAVHSMTTPKSHSEARRASQSKNKGNSPKKKQVAKKAVSVAPAKRSEQKQEQRSSVLGDITSARKELEKQRREAPTKENHIKKKNNIEI